MKKRLFFFFQGLNPFPGLLGSRITRCLLPPFFPPLLFRIVLSRPSSTEAPGGREHVPNLNRFSRSSSMRRNAVPA